MHAWYIFSQQIKAAFFCSSPFYIDKDYSKSVNILSDVVIAEVCQVNYYECIGVNFWKS